jgi:hypothetical protein
MLPNSFPRPYLRLLCKAILRRIIVALGIKLDLYPGPRVLRALACLCQYTKSYSPFSPLDPYFYVLQDALGAKVIALVANCNLLPGEKVTIDYAELRGSDLGLIRHWTL